MVSRFKTGQLYAGFNLFKFTTVNLSMKKYLLGCVFFIPLFLSNNLSAQITSNFNTNSDGWTVADINNLNPQTVNYSSTGGNPGGYTSVTYSGGQSFYWNAPSKFLGQHCLSSVGMYLRFDLKFSANTGLVHGGTGDVILYNNTTAIAINLPSFPATASWTSYAIKLDTAKLLPWHNGSTTGAVSTHNDILYVLGNLTKVSINGQYKTASGTISSIDNIILETTLLGTPPAITSFSPKTGLPGLTSITITGSNFNPTPANNLVYFGGVKAAISSSTTSQLVVTVPPGSLYAPIVVINKSTGLEASTIEPFRPTFDNNKDFGGQIIRATMAPLVSIDLDGYAGGGEVGDIDGDGLNDMIVAEGNLKKFSVFRNAGVTGTITSASFASKVSFLMTNTGKGYITLSDFDGDGKLDVALSAASTFASEIAVFRNTSTPGTISFDAPLYFNGYSYSDGPLTSADMDGDGRPEIVSVFNNNCGSGDRLYILPNRSTPGTIDFCAYSSFATVYTCGGFVTVGDLDGDKLPDVLVSAASGSSTVTAFKNTSTPGVVSMGSGFVITTTGQEGRPVIADLDNDGKNDIGWPYYPNKIEIRKNVYAGGAFDASAFSAGILFNGVVGFSNSTSEMVAADINGDGKLDLITNGAGGGDNMSIWQNVSTPGTLDASSFLPGVAYPTPSNGLGLASPKIADFDGDNKPDIFLKTTSYSAPVKIFLFHNESYPTPRIDNLSSSSGSAGNTITLTGNYFSTGTAPSSTGRLGPLAATITPSSNTSASAIVPVNSASNRFSLSTHGLTGFSKPFNVLFGTSRTINSTSFPASINFTLTGGTIRDALDVADFDDDGLPDITVADGSVKIFKNTHAVAGQPITAASLTLQTTTYTEGYNVISLDIDGDGKIDLHNGYGLIKNNSTAGAISFLYGPNGTYTPSGSFTGVAASDFNKDGKEDLAVTTGGALVRLYENRSTTEPFMYNGEYSTFAITPVDLTKPGGNGVVVAADFDGDGYDDLAATTNSTNNFTFYRNLAAYGPITAASFSTGTNVTTGTTPYGLTASDFDGDGKMDIAVTHFNALFVSVYLNTSTTGVISFAAPVNFTTVNKGYNIVSQDLDGDGQAEIVVIHQPNPVGSFTVLQNKSTVGTVNFSVTNFPITRNPQQLNIADINSDKKPDILIVANSGTLGNALMVFENKIVSVAVITVDAQPVNASVCDGETASFTTSASGTTNITYQWQFASSVTAPFNDITNSGGYSGATTNTLSINTTGNFGAGQYRCKINGDLAITVFTNGVGLTVNTVPAAPITTGSSKCNAASFTLSASGGTNGQYRWYTGQTGAAISGAVNDTYATPLISATTTYYVSITNGSCESSRTAVTATLTSLSKPVLSFNPTTTDNTVNLCEGQTQTILAPVGFKKYVWSNSDTTAQIVITQTGAYSVIVKDASGCISPSSDAITVTVNPYPQATITSDNVDLIASAGDYYQWYSSGLLIQGATSQTLGISVLEFGVYAVDVTTKGCTTHSDDFAYLVTGIEKHQSSFKVYPNPVKDELTVEIPANSNSSVTMVDLMGKEVKINILETSSGKIISTKDLNTGTYFLILHSTRSKNYFKILKQ